MLLAGVGVLLLAMGLGVLIGRSGAPSSSGGSPQVIQVGSTPNGGPSANTAGSQFTSDWPSGSSGYTIELQSLPQASTSAAAVTQAKAAASAKGAREVGALRSEDFPSLTAGSYYIYSGVDPTKAAAEKALGRLKRSFPGASVIKVSAAAGTSASGASRGSSVGAGGAGSGSGSSKPGSSPPATGGSHSKSGRSYEQESKNLPNVVTTG